MTQGSRPDSPVITWRSCGVPRIPGVPSSLAHRNVARAGTSIKEPKSSKAFFMFFLRFISFLVCRVYAFPSKKNVIRLTGPLTEASLQIKKEILPERHVLRIRIIKILNISALY
jgi:hypothetical protein